jgi:hypothetical protein
LSPAAQGWPQSARGNPRAQNHCYAWSTRLAKGPECRCRAQALERKPSNAWARKMPTLIRPKTAVTASPIANVLCVPAQTKRPPCCTVKRNPDRDRKSGRTGDLAQQFHLATARAPCRTTPACRTQIAGRPRQPLIHHAPQLSPFPPRSGCDIFIP